MVVGWWVGGFVGGGGGGGVLNEFWVSGGGPPAHRTPVHPWPHEGCRADVDRRHQPQGQRRPAAVVREPEGERPRAEADVAHLAAEGQRLPLLLGRGGAADPHPGTRAHLSPMLPSGCGRGAGVDVIPLPPKEVIT